MKSSDGHLGALQPGPGDTVTLLSDDGSIIMRLPFDANDIGRTVSAPDAVQEFIHRGVAASAVRASGEWGAREIAFHRVGNLPLVVSVSSTMDKSTAFWLFAVCAAGALAVAMLPLVDMAGDACTPGR